MALSPGVQLGSYRIVASIGAGGMGEVYRATDTRLGREVALKVLPAHLAGIADSRERFEREAKVISSLSHPNICTLFDIGTQDDVTYLVMELLEGESLAARLEKGPLKTDEVMRYGAQVADALDKAHRKGIVHRDLKPANLMLTKTGVKVLDFGVAKLSEGRYGTTSGTGILPTLAPTRTTPLTMQGAIVGTMQYMAPEQLEGKSVDHRADIFSLGAVLFEMVTGKRAFEGASQASVIAAVLEREPRPVSEIIAGSPPSLDRTIGRCLHKDPEERWQSALDVKSELEWIATQSGTARAAARSATAGRRRGARSAAVIAALAAVAAFGLGWMLHRPETPPARLMRASIVVPSGTSLDTDNASLALSPDGTMLVYAGRERGGARTLYVRPLDSLTSQPLAGTNGATYPFWSPDGRQIGFFADRKLKKVPAAGGAVLTICDAEDGRGASWGADGTIIFAPRPRGGLSAVPASGGAAAPVTSPENEALSHRNPHFLSDGKRLLFFSGNNAGDETNGIYSLEIASRKIDLVLKADSEGIPVDSGHLVFVRDGNLMAQTFDPGALRLSGEAVPIAENVQFNTFRYTGTYTVSNGLLLFQSGAIQGNNQLTWYDLEGKKLGTVGEPAIFWLFMEISPDGRRAAATVRHPNGGSDVWTYDLSRGIGTRFTLGETNANALVPLWSPDGLQLAFIDGGGTLSVKEIDGGTPERKVYTGDSGLIPTDWSKDGSFILYTTQSVKTGGDIMLMPMTGEAKPAPFIVTPANEEAGVFSPDGRWVAYVSDESGRSEVYVRSFPEAGGKWQVSAQGATSVQWTGTGGEIYVEDLDGKVYTVPVKPSGAGLEIGAPRPLFGGEALPVSTGAFTPDGKRFLGAAQLSGDTGPVLTLVTNWTSALPK